MHSCNLTVFSSAKIRCILMMLGENDMQLTQREIDTTIEFYRLVHLKQLLSLLL